MKDIREKKYWLPGTVFLKHLLHYKYFLSTEISNMYLVIIKFNCVIVIFNLDNIILCGDINLFL